MTDDELRRVYDSVGPMSQHVSRDTRHAAALRAVFEAGARAQWIPVGERLPEPEVVDGDAADFVPVLFVRHGFNNQICAGRYLPKKSRWPWITLQGLEIRRKDVTHWMPLPSAPLAGKGEG